MTDNDKTATVNSVTDLRKPVKRKLEEKKFECMNYLQKRMRYLKVKTKIWEDMKMEKKFSDTNTLPLSYHEELWYKLLQKIDFSKEDKDDIERKIEDKMRIIQKYAIDYVGIWDARTVEEALNWFAVADMEEDCLCRFVELVLKEQPEKNFSEALERVCKAWDDIRKVYRYEELLNDDAKSEKVKLEYCDWLGTETKERDVTLYKYKELWDPLREKLLLPDDVDLGQMLSDLKFYGRHSIDYVIIWDARAAEEVLNWIVVFRNPDITRRFIELVLIEQPEKNFSEALERVCKAWNDIRKVYTYKELFNKNWKNRKYEKVKFEYCDWLRTEKKAVS